MCYLCNFLTTAQSKQSPIGRKFAQSGHPGRTTNNAMPEKSMYLGTMRCDMWSCDMHGWITPLLFSSVSACVRVARGYILETKIQIWVDFGGLALEDFGVFYGHLIYIVYCYLEYFVVIWYIFPVLVCCTKKNLATLVCVLLKLDSFL
jgi:hypothetical protein